jgi:hypothetical protein
MGNRVEHHRITIDFDVWEPFKKDCEVDMDELANGVKAKKLLKHCGNIHIKFEDVKGE